MPTHLFSSSVIGEPTIDFSSVEIEYELENDNQTSSWLEAIIEREGCRLGTLNFVFCSDEYLHRLNVEYLDHDTLTDVITFPYATPPYIEGDVYISIDRIRDNAKDFEVPEPQELHRVMVHGVLHLCGYRDKTEEESRLMKKKEDEALELLAGMKLKEGA